CGSSYRWVYFSLGEKKPAEAGFSQDHYRLPVGSDPCIWSIIRDPETLPVSQLMGVDYVSDPISNSRHSYHRV
ncbi:hypothetical protein, partial [Pseudomonas sp. GM80]|uniref:hypothetical protein n=1 Tax=Pseudomonas sp. GM80 TaxID=1144339 RepID=UPI001EE6584B